MVIHDRDPLVCVAWKDGRGFVVGWVSRVKRVCAIVVVRSKLVVVPLSELRVVHPRRKKVK